MRGRVLGRRALLRGGAAGVTAAIALPRLGAMLDGNGAAYADGTPLPRRWGLWTWANGVYLKRWVPAATGAGYAMSDELAPLEPVRDSISIVSGLGVPYDGRGHAVGPAWIATGGPVAGTDDSNYTASKRSIDQVIADVIGKTTRLRTLEVGSTPAPAGGVSGTIFAWWSHNGPNSPNRCDYSCKSVFNRLFGGAPAPSGGAPAAAASDLASRMRRSVLDLVAQDAADLQKVLGAADRARLDQHLEGIRSIERRLDAVATGGGAPMPAGAGCGHPTAPADALVGVRGDYDAMMEEVNRTMSDLVAVAFACDITRVVTYEFAQPAATYGVDTITGAKNPSAHTVSHSPPSDPRNHLIAVHAMKQLSVFVQALRAVPEGAGKLLDSCGILATTDIAEGATHSVKDLPMIVVGRAGGLRSGIHYRSATGENAIRVPLTIARAVGAPLAEHGMVTDSLGAILS